MRISPITNTTPQPQTSPAFQARVPKNIVKQLLNKAEPLKSINILSKTGIAFTVPAFAAAKLYANNSDVQLDESKLASLSRVEKLPTSEELAKLSDEDLINIAQVQDADGNTIFHIDNNPEALKRFLDKAPHKTAAEVFMLKDEDNYTAYISNDDSRMNELMKDGIQKIATSGELSVEKAIQLLSDNRFNGNLTEFLKMREYKVGDTPPSSSVNPALYKQVTERTDGKLDVQTKFVTYKDMPMREAARLFITDSTEPEFAWLDRKYLNEWANADEIRTLLNSAFLDPDAKCIQDIMSTSYDNIKATYDHIKASIDPSKIKIEDIEMMTHLIKSAYNNHLDIDVKFKHKNDAPNMVKNLYTYVEDEDGLGILAHSASRPDSDFEKHLDLLGRYLEEEDIDRLIFNDDNMSSSPMNCIHVDGKAAEAILDQYKDKPDMISKIFKNTDILYRTQNTNVLEGLFEQLKDKPEELAKILGNHTETPYKNSFEKNPESPYTKLLENKIIELATDSDLSLNNSIELLENNKLAPQLKEFLKMQKEEKDA